MMLLNLKSVVVGILVVKLVGAPTPCSYYSTNGAGQLASDEGVKLVAPSGVDKLVAKTAQDCVAACEVQQNGCSGNCCDGVSYNPKKQDCYLKFGGSRFESTESDNGWQSYWRVGSGLFNGDSASELMSVAGGAAACEDDVQISGYANAYVSMGPGKLAEDEGESVETTDGEVMVKVKTVDECALECESVAVCNAFTMNLNTGSCYLKQGAKQFDTSFSEGGWTTYWKVPEMTAKDLCPQETFYCLYCGGNLKNSCRNY
eukprot:TRINITY_DN29191_c2_g1_i1.p2 TRINITY_DN29191_c2_g1~~TRINITY_DN29191_c2_g1_i1.p2  ORF type:complete len:259 (-),score=39.51 TRINITY_DN29191_c2_g1_i1:331-1107(-)